MKIAFAFVLLVMISTAYANEFMGGQTGNGGNGCWLNTNSGIEWKSIEELTYPELIQWENRFATPVELPPYLKTAKLVNFNSIYGAKNLYKRLERLALIAPNITKTLKEFSRLFEVSYVVPFQLPGLFEAELKIPFKACRDFSPALMTLNDGTIIFFQPVWERLPVKSMEIIIIHETIRLAQVFHPAFRSLSNKDLQLLVSLLFSHEKNKFRIARILEDIEYSLYWKTYPVNTLPFPATNSDGLINTRQAFNSVLLEGLMNNELPVNSLNYLRTQNRPFTRTVLEKILNLKR